MTNKVKLLTAFFVLSFAMMIGVLPFSIGGAGVLKAEADTGTGDFKVEVISGSNDDYSYTGNVLTISGDGEYKISMASNVTETNTDTIQVTSEDDAVIVLNGVNISSSSNSPIEIASTAGKVTIKLEEENTLTATGNAHTGLAISTTSEVTITSDFDDENNSYAGSLTVSDDNETTSDGVAIGSESTEVNIKITGGDITAEADGDCYGVAIGSYTGDANITITGGDITAEADGDEYGIAIGSYSGDANITIEEGTVYAEADATTGFASSGDVYGVGIGSYSGNADITIKDGKVTAIAGTDNTVGISDASFVVGIGSYLGTANITIEKGTVDAEVGGYQCVAIGTSNSGDEYTTNITIKGGTVTAKIDADQVDIDGYHLNPYAAAIGSLWNGNVEIDITGGEIIADAGDSNSMGGFYTAVAIGSCSIDGTVDNVDIDITGGEITAKAGGTTYVVGIGSIYGTVDITINGGTVTAETDGDYYQYNRELFGIAIGSYRGLANITIEDGTVTAEANNDGCGIAIGVYEYPDIYTSSTITITGGKVTAKADSDNFGLAIGAYRSNVNIIITGGEITAEADGDEYGIAIGGEYDYYGNVTITIAGGKVTAEADSDEFGVAIGNSTGTATVTITGGEITAEAKNDNTGYAVYASNVRILPDGATLNVGYTTNAVYDSESESYEPTDMKYMLCAAETDISGITGGKDYFYCNIMIYQISDYISIEASDDGAYYNVIVSVFGGENARYLDEVMVLACDGTTGNITISNLEFYEKYEPRLGGNEAIVFSVDSNSISEGATIYALVKTYYNYDAENENNDTVYYLSEDSCTVSGGDAA